MLLSHERHIALYNRALLSSRTLEKTQAAVLEHGIDTVFTWGLIAGIVMSI